MITSASPPTRPPADATIVGDRHRAWFKALETARAAKKMGAKPTYQHGFDRYTVRSPRSGELHTVTPDYHALYISYVCSCRSGGPARACWHRAMVASLPDEVDRRRGYAQAMTALARQGRVG